jgi:hypothetical protein
LSLGNLNTSVISCAPWNPSQKQLSHLWKVKNIFGISLIKHPGERAHACTPSWIFEPGESLIIMRFANALVRSRPLKEKGAEQVRSSLMILSHFALLGRDFQLLIDLSTLKSSLLRLPGEALTTTG